MRVVVGGLLAAFGLVGVIGAGVGAYPTPRPQSQLSYLVRDTAAPAGCVTFAWTADGPWPGPAGAEVWVLPTDTGLILALQPGKPPTAPGPPPPIPRPGPDWQAATVWYERISGGATWVRLVAVDPGVNWGPPAEGLASVWDYATARLTLTRP